ncbi:MAG: zinc ribbon domain-containing protein [Chloroflexia bacterium]
MFCPNCGQPCPEGATVCPSCGSPLTPPVPAPPPIVPEPTALPTASGLAWASFLLGLASVLGVILYVGIVLAYSAGLSPENLRSQEFLLRYIQEHPLLYAGSGCCFLGELGALVGLILGIVGLSRERVRPTRLGRTFSILGIAIGALPLLCCIAYFVLLFLALASGGVPWA